MIQTVDEGYVLAGVSEFYCAIGAVGNDQFLAYAETENWVGNGTKASPYLIDEDRGGFQTVMDVPIGFLSQNDWNGNDTNLIDTMKGNFDGA